MTDTEIVKWIGQDGSGSILMPDSLEEGYEGGKNADWRMKDWIGGGGGPWYWYVPKQQPMCFSYYGELFADFWGPQGVGPASAGFYLLPNYPILEIIPDNFFEQGSIGAPIPPVGAASLEDAITNFSPNPNDFLGQQVPNGGFDNIGGVWGLLGPHGDDGLEAGIGSPMTEPPQSQGIEPWSRLLADGFGGFVPNIWQLTGLPQPPLKNPSLPWDPVNNPYTAPTAALAAQCANTFVNFWNKVAKGQNDLAASFSGQNPSNPPGFDYTGPIPPDWPFATPFVDIAKGLSGVLNFNAGLPIGFFVFPLIELPAATSMTLAIGQLNQTKWDTTTFPPTLRNP